MVSPPLQCSQGYAVPTTPIKKNQGSTSPLPTEKQPQNQQATLNRTYLAFQHNAKLSTLPAIIQSIFSASTLDDATRAAFKGLTLNPTDHVVITDQTLFHPQGGGQPSDEGHMTDSTNTTTFTVTAARTGLSTFTGQVLHLGTFDPPTTTTRFRETSEVTQHLDVAKRTLFSRYHTAGHVLGSAVRHLCDNTTPDFDELKANHFPATASCEFQGLLPGTLKPEFQAKVDEFVARDMPVEIEFWSEDDFRANGVERLIPDRTVLGMDPEEKFRVVRIVGAEVYPCGGTHVDSTRFCGRTTVRKIARQKGTSKVSYALDHDEVVV